MQLLPGNTSTPISLTDLATDTTIDRANTFGVAALPAGVAVPTDCNINGTTGRDSDYSHRQPLRAV
jgi:hypothetical protein